MSASVLTLRRDGLVTMLLTSCLVVTVLATLLEAPVVVRVPVAVPGVLLAPGQAWLTVLSRRPDTRRYTLMSTTLAAVLSLAALPLVGVLLNSVGVLVTPVSLGLGLLALTLPATILVLRASRMAEERVAVDAERPEPSHRTMTRHVLQAASVALFVAAVAWGASWQHIVDTGPFAQLSYAGDLTHLSGPLVVRPSQPVTVPLQLTTSDGQPWVGTITLRVDTKVELTRAVRLESKDVVPIVVSSPREQGLHDVTTMATRDGTGEVLILTLRLRVTTK